MNLITIYNTENNKIIDAKVASSEYSGRPSAFAEKFSLTGNWVEIEEELKPAIGRVFNKELGVYVPEQPYPSWTFDKETRSWYPPTPHPEDNNQYGWNEETLGWTLIENTEE